MERSLQSTAEIISTLQSSEKCKLLVVPDDLLRSQLDTLNYNTEEHMMIIEERGKVEVIIDKTKVKLIIKECYPLIKASFLSNASVSEDQLFLATCGILLVLNEHSTVINKHTKILFDKLLKSNSEIQIIIQRELLFLRTLLTCNNPKINKSSSLWTLFKRLYIHVISRDLPNLTPNIHQFFIATVIESAKAHANNYYAWLSLKFLIQITRLRKYHESLELVREEIWTYIQSHVNESAAWDCLVCCYTINFDSLHCVSVECQNWGSKEFELSRHDCEIDDAFLQISYTKLIEIKDWIIQRRVSSSAAPYEALKNLSCWGYHNAQGQEYKEKIYKVMRFPSEKVGLMGRSVQESLRCSSISVKNGFYVSEDGEVVNKRMEDLDLVSSESVQVYCHWLRLDVFYKKFFPQAFELATS